MTQNRRVGLYYSVRSKDGKWAYKPIPKKNLKNLTEGNFYLIYYEGWGSNGKARKHTENVGKLVDVAKIALAQKEADLRMRIVRGSTSPVPEHVPSESTSPAPEPAPAATPTPEHYRRAHGITLWAPEPAPAPTPTPSIKDAAESVYGVDDEIATYLGNAAKLASKTYKAYKCTLGLFRKSCSKQYVHQITKQDLQAFDTDLMKEGQDDRTRANYVGHVVTFLRTKEGRRQGPEIIGVSIKVKYVESPPEAYTRGELQDLIRVSSEGDKFLWRFFLGTGFRETEVAVAEKTDINRDTKTIRVDEKRYFDFKPKDCEKRSVPISDALLAEIEAGSSLLFPNTEGNPDGHLLRRLKTVAFKGGMSAGVKIGHSTPRERCVAAE
jgi:integrase